MSTPEIVDPYDITVRSNDLGRRRLTEKLVSVVALLSALLAVLLLALVLGSVIAKGLSTIDLDFFTKSSALFGEKGGIADALVGSMLIVAMATIIAVPIAILVAIYIAEYAGPTAASFFRVTLDILNGVPAILIGIFIYGLLVVGHGQSAIYGAMALAILMIPMVARATQEVLELVPRHLREASLALGVPRWRTVYSIVLPTAIGGMLTGVVIAVARVAGETAPLIFTSSIVTSQGVSFDVHESLATLPVRIFTLSESASPDDQAAAWAAALVLIAFVLVMNILAKFFAGRKRRSLEGI
jgi:phosphate transport system permease protein